MEHASAKSREQIKANWERIRGRMAEAARNVSRPLDKITLIAVTKYVGLAEMKALIELGVRDFGESRVQDAEQKVKALAGVSVDSPLNFHLIGHLQTNKADKAAKLFSTIHSVDSLRVAQALGKERLKTGLPPLRCFLEVNVAGEASKFGLPPQLVAITDVLKQAAALPAISIKGLMAMAPHSETPEASSRVIFRRLRGLLEESNASGVYPAVMEDLSMGMTQDYDIAIEEGATMVRVGSALFE